jgi:hypothetical protein
VGLASLCAAVTAAEPPAVLTLIEGEAALLRGTAGYALAEGVRLQAGDIVELGEKGIAQIEFADGFILSLGPGARFYAGLLAPRGAKGDGASELYLLRGWSKFASRKGVAPFRYTTPGFGIWTADATAVVRISDGGTEMFVETGEARLAEGFAKASPASAIRVKGGDYVARRGDEPAAIQARPERPFVVAMPRQYMDNLPSRMAKYKDRVAVPQPNRELGYADVELWLKAPREIRRVVMRPFIREARSDSAFRNALVANLRFHPEWDPILFPEKYEPKPQPAPPRAVVEPTRPEPAKTPAATPRPAASPAATPRPAASPAATPRPAASPAAAPRPAASPRSEPLPPVTVEDAGPGRPQRSE